jgi:hypothetical protein
LGVEAIAADDACEGRESGYSNSHFGDRLKRT